MPYNIFAMRDDIWLTNRLVKIWKENFPDINDGNELEIHFGRNSKTRLGSIVMRKKSHKKRRLLRSHVRSLTADDVVSIVTISGFFRDEDIPESVVDGIIAHEFCHFVHGFNSMREKRFCNPHQGGIIDKELKQRGLEETLKFQKKWVKENWQNYIKGK